MTTSTKVTLVWQQILRAPADQTLKDQFVIALQEAGDERAKVFSALEDIEKNPGWHIPEEPSIIEKYSAALWHEQLDGVLKESNAQLRFVKGFPAEITIAARDFVVHAADLVKTIPLRHLNLRNITAAPEVFDVPQLAQIASLDASSQPLSGAPIEALATSHGLCDLSWLNLSRCELLTADVELLAAASQFRKITYIDLTGNKCADPCDASLGYGCDQYNQIVWESVNIPEFGRDLEAKYGRLEWVRGLENSMKKYPPDRYL